jgi:putative hydrolase of the HAD superfamily
MRAVIFDLFGTLTDPAAEVGRREVFGETAAALGVGPAEFWSAMSATFADRITGRHGGTVETLRMIAERCGADPTRLERAAAVHLAGAERLRAPRPAALDVLDELRRRGFVVGLLSDCSSEVAEGWETSPYASRIDAAVLSWTEGCRKPDPRLYDTVAARLGVQTQECWYVGDGGGRELAGARYAGMTPVLVTNAAVPEAAAHRADPDGYRPVLAVDDVTEILQLVGEAAG